MKRQLAASSALSTVTALVIAGCVLPAQAAGGPDLAVPDVLNTSTPGTLDFGKVCAGGSASGQVSVVLKRGGNGNGNTWQNSAAVAISTAGITSAPPFAAGSISGSPINLPSSWQSSGTVSSAATATVSYTPSAAGVSTGTVTYSASGTAQNGSTYVTTTPPVNLKGEQKVCDTTPPVITPSVSGPLGNNDWYVGDVTVDFTVTDPDSAVTSQSADCADVTRTTDTTGVTYTCTATSAGGTHSASVTIKRDATKPFDLAVSPDRAPTNGWYNAPFTATWTGDDLTSGIASCTQTTYSGPDTNSGSLSGSCTDLAGNTQAGPGFPFQYDATGPIVTGTPDRGADHNGWYNGALTVTWSAADGGSEITCDAPTTYDGPDSATGSVSGTCADEAGNAGGGSFGFQYDDTAPAASLSPSRAPDHDGWYNAPFTATTTGTDVGGSGVETCTEDQTYGDDEDDTVSGQLSGTCTDLAGNTSDPATFDFKYDDTAPSATLTLDEVNLANGWYHGPVTGTTSGEDNLSEVTCSPEQTYSGPDGTNKQLSGSCTDAAGNESLPDTKVFNYDATAPGITLVSRTPANANGWNNSAVTVVWACSDATSLPIADEVSDTKGDEGENQTAIGTCQDNAGNTSSDSVGNIDIDLTKPGASIAADRAADSNGWYNHAIVATTTGSDELSGLDSCSEPQTYGDEPGEGDTASGELAGTCTDKAGNVSNPATLSFQYDASAPAAPTPHVDPAANAAGWNNAKPVTVSFTGNGDTGPSGVASCTTDQQVDVETAGQSVSGTCTDEAGNVSDPASVTVKVDVTAPSAPTLTAGVPAYGAWHLDSVTVTSADNGDVGDVQSGVDPSTVGSATTFTTSGEHTVTDSVEDVADNESATTSLTVKVDATKPVVSVSCPAQVVLGSTASAAWTASDLHSGVAGTDHGSVVLDTATVGAKTATLAAGAATDNVGHASDAASCGYSVVYGWDGFLQPINDTAHTGLYESKFKLGSTVPVKFVIKNAAGGSVQSSTVPQFQVSGNRGVCDTQGTSEAVPDSTATGGTAYKWTDGQYHYNFSTKGKTPGEYRVWVTGLDDGVNHYVDLCLTK